MTIGFFIWDNKWGGCGGSAFALNLYKCTSASLGFIVMSLVCGFTTTTTTATTNTFNSAAAAAEAAGEEAFSTRNVGYLILSSTLGIIIGDVLWLQALLILGAKQVIVIDSLRPFCAAILGRVVLNETLGLAAWGGMVLTVGGVVIVAIEDGRRNTTTMKKTTDVTMVGNVDLGVHREERVTMADDANENNNIKKKEDVEQEPSARSISINSFNDDRGLDVNDAVFDTRTRTDETVRTIVTDINSTIYNNNDDEIRHKNNESNENVEQKNQRNRNRIGYACAFINVFADSFGSLLQKRHGTGMTTWSINLIRFGFGGFILCVISVLMRIRDRWSIRRKRIVADKSSKKSSIISSSKGRMRGDSLEQQQDSSTTVILSCHQPPSTTPPPPPRWYELPTLTKKGWLQINAGVALVTFFSPALWNFALLRIALGLAVALGSVGPVYGLILDWPFKGQIPTLVGLVGVLLTVVGVVILCIWGT
jgi:drug/metabolite transporter (DMT)-like permease